MRASGAAAWFATTLLACGGRLEQQALDDASVAEAGSVDVLESSDGANDADGSSGALAVLVRDASRKHLALVLADAKTGAVVRRSGDVPAPLPMDGHPNPKVSPDTQHALIAPADDGNLYRFDVADVSGRVIAGPGIGGDGVTNAEWSHDGSRLCLTTVLTVGGAYVESVDASDGGSRVLVRDDPLHGSLVDCQWSNDDGAIAWLYDSRVLVSLSTGGTVYDVSGTERWYDGFQFAGWSPTERRLAYSLPDSSTPSASLWRTFTDLFGSPAVDIEEQAPFIVGFSSDGEYLAYEVSTPSVTKLRRAPVGGPADAAIDLTPPLSSGGFFTSASLSPDTHWIVHPRRVADASAGFYVTSFAGSGTTEFAGATAAWGPWSPNNVLVWIDDVEGGRLYFFDPVAASPTPVSTPFGAPQRPGEQIYGMTWSPDGRSLAYVRSAGRDAGSPSTICVVSGSRLVERCTDPMTFPPYAPVRVEWSADGESLAFGAWDVVYVAASSDLAPKRVPVESGAGNVYAFWWVRA